MLSLTPEMRARQHTVVALNALVPDLDVLGEAYHLVRSTDGVQSMLKEYDLQPVTQYAWEHGYDQHRLHSGDLCPRPHLTNEGYSILNVARIIELEEARPGSARVLQARNNMSNFARASKWMLTYLYDNRLRPAKRIISSVVAASDRNGAFIDVFDDYETFLKKLPKDTDTVFETVELRKAVDTSKLADAVRDHGDDAKAHVLSFNMHGKSTGGTIIEAYYGRSGTKIHFEATDVDTYVVPLMEDIGIDETTIVMNSCSTGKGDKSIGGYINQSTGMRTYAPIEPVWIGGLTFRDEKDIIHPHVRYRASANPNAGCGGGSRDSITRTFKKRPVRTLDLTNEEVRPDSLVTDTIIAA